MKTATSQFTKRMQDLFFTSSSKGDGMKQFKQQHWKLPSVNQVSRMNQRRVSYSSDVTNFLARHPLLHLVLITVKWRHQCEWALICNRDWKLSLHHTQYGIEATPSPILQSDTLPDTSPLYRSRLGTGISKWLICGSRDTYIREATLKVICCQATTYLKVCFDTIHKQRHVQFSCWK